MRRIALCALLCVVVLGVGLTRQASAQSRLERDCVTVYDDGSVWLQLCDELTNPPTVTPWPTPTQIASPRPPTATPTNERVHVVRSGDTLYGLAWRYYGNGAVYYRIMTANNLTSTTLVVGQALIIP